MDITSYINDSQRTIKSNKCVTRRNKIKMTDKSRNQRPHSHNIDYYRPAWLYDANSIPSNYLNTYSPLLPTALP